MAPARLDGANAHRNAPTWLPDELSSMSQESDDEVTVATSTSNRTVPAHPLLYSKSAFPEPVLSAPGAEQHASCPACVVPPAEPRDAHGGPTCPRRCGSCEPWARGRGSLWLRRRGSRLPVRQRATRQHRLVLSACLRNSVSGVVPGALGQDVATGVTIFASPSVW